MLPEPPLRLRVHHHWKGVGNYSTVGLQLGLSVLLGLYGGWWLDQKLDSSPWLMLIGLGLGVVAGFRALWRALQQANREADRLDEQEREARRKYHDGSSQH